MPIRDRRQTISTAGMGTVERHPKKTKATMPWARMKRKDLQQNPITCWVPILVTGQPAD